MNRYQPPCWANAIEKVPNVWQEEFVRFIEEGEASDEFLEYFGADPICQEAFEISMRSDLVLTEVMKDVVECDRES